MIIGIDASRALRARRTGTENYSLQLIRRLVSSRSGHLFRLYCDGTPPLGLFGDQEGWAARVMPFPRLWTHVRLSVEMAANPPDVLFVPAHVLPIVHPSRSVATVHDLGFVHYPEAHPGGQRAYLRWSTNWNVHQSAHILTDSEATKSDIIDLWALPDDRITVVYPGRDESLRPVSDERVLTDVRGRYGLAERYVLHLGTLQPRKNLVRLIDAFATLDVPGLQLVLAGPKGWLSEPIFGRVQELGLSDSVHFPGYVDSRDVAALLTGASCFAFPSLYEGFGFPILEAQSCGTPVVASAASSIPEVAGDGALLVDPHDTSALAEALTRVLTQRHVSTELVSRGFKNLERFSWDRCARETMAVLEQVGATA